MSNEIETAVESYREGLLTEDEFDEKIRLIVLQTIVDEKLIIESEERGEKLISDILSYLKMNFIKDERDG